MASFEARIVPRLGFGAAVRAGSLVALGASLISARLGHAVSVGAGWVIARLFIRIETRDDA